MGFQELPSQEEPGGGISRAFQGLPGFPIKLIVSFATSFHTGSHKASIRFFLLLDPYRNKEQATTGV
jgi:hypothetical protein